MRIRITFNASGLVIPIHYQHIFQGMIYNLITDYSLTDEIHDSKEYKPFNFSEIMGQAKYLNGNLIFNNLASMEISSIDNQVISEIIIKLNEDRFIKIINQNYEIVEVKVLPFPNINADYIDVKMISPVTAHKTIDNKTIYFNPLQDEFFRMLNANFTKKAKVEENALEFSRIKDIKKVVVLYKNKKFIIEAYKFKCRIKATRENLIKLYQLGLGEKNAQGFGMIEIINNGGKNE